MAQWLFSYNIPLVMNNFFYLMTVLIVIVAVATGWYAAKEMKKAEALMPADEAFMAAQAEKAAAKAAKKAK